MKVIADIVPAGGHESASPGAAMPPVDRSSGGAIRTAVSEGEMEPEGVVDIEHETRRHRPDLLHHPLDRY